MKQMTVWALFDSGNGSYKQDVEWKHFSNSYNERSNIPQNLVIEIFTKVYNKFLQEK